MQAHKSIFPTDHWPDFLKLALSTGTKQEAPLSRLINNFIGKIVIRAGVRVTPGVYPFFGDTQMRLHLTGLGFHCQSLSKAQVINLNSIHFDLLRNWGNPQTIIRLAQIYLGPCNLIRGHHFANSRIHSQRLKRLRLGDTTANQRYLTVLFQKEFLETISPIRIREFVKSAQNLLPSQYQVRVKGNPTAEARPPFGRKLIPFTLNPRRIAPCLTLPK